MNEHTMVFQFPMLALKTFLIQKYGYDVMGTYVSYESYNGHYFPYPDIETTITNLIDMHLFDGCVIDQYRDVSSQRWVVDGVVMMNEPAIRDVINSSVIYQFNEYNTHSADALYADSLDGAEPNPYANLTVLWVGDNTPELLNFMTDMIWWTLEWFIQNYPQFTNQLQGNQYYNINYAQCEGCDDQFLKENPNVIKQAWGNKSFQKLNGFYEVELSYSTEYKSH